MDSRRSSFYDAQFEFDVPQINDFTKEALEMQKQDNADVWFDHVGQNSGYVMTEKELETEYSKYMKAAQEESNEALFNPDSHLSSSQSTFGGSIHEMNPSSLNSSLKRHSNKPLKLTVPKSPYLLTKLRNERSEQELMEERRREEEEQARRAHKRQYTGVLTVPESPSLLTRERNHSAYSPVKISTEEIMLKRSREEYEERQQKRRKMLEKVTNETYKPQVNIPLTVPEEFSFHTDDRIRYTREEDASPPKKRVRNYVPGSLTVTQPFEFHTDARNDFKPTIAAPKSPFVSFLQRTTNFQKNLKHNDENVSESKHNTSKLTVPEGFSFATSSRLETRPRQDTLTTEEKKILEAINAPKFKATPFDRSIFNQTNQSFTSHKNEKPLTVPQPFEFHTDSRLRSDISLSNHSDLNMSMNSSMLRSHNSTMNSSYRGDRFNSTQDSFGKSQYKFHMGSNPKPLTKTVPRSPKLRTKDRGQYKSNNVTREEDKFNFTYKANPIPKSISHPFQFVAPQNFEATKPVPFSLKTEQRGQESEKEFQARMEKEAKQREEARKFKASDILYVEQPFQPEKKVILTEKVPFKLQTTVRGSEHQDQLKIKIDKEWAEKLEQAKYRAKEYVAKQPFEVTKQPKQPIEIDQFVLKSEQRAQRRQLLDVTKRERDLITNEDRKRQESIQSEKEKMELLQYRKGLVLKANPIISYKPIQINKSMIPLTEPHSPSFKTTRRLRDL